MTGVTRLLKHINYKGIIPLEFMGTSVPCKIPGGVVHITPMNVHDGTVQHSSPGFRGQ